MRLAGIVCLPCLLLFPPQQASYVSPPIGRWEVVEQALGTSGRDLADGVHYFEFFRATPALVFDGVRAPASFGTASTAVFRESGGVTSLLADLIITGPELARLLADDSHLSVRVMFIHPASLSQESDLWCVHLSGMGPSGELANGLRAMLASTRMQAVGSLLAEHPTAEAQEIQRLFGPGEIRGQVYRQTLFRQTDAPGHRSTKGSDGPVSSIELARLTDALYLVLGTLAVEPQRATDIRQRLGQAGIQIQFVHSVLAHSDSDLLVIHFIGTGPIHTLHTALSDVLRLVDLPLGQSLIRN